MSELSRQERVALFASLFRGRADVFARRWEKSEGGPSGYAPAYVDWRTKDTYVPLDTQILEKHLLGDIVVGIYPMLADNTSHFVAADFDEEGWYEDARRLIAECKKFNIPVYLERSRSGKGGHVWCFFENNYPAHKSRTIFLSLLRASKNIDEFAVADSFDRLFPNQDYLSRKGFGNLIALPLQGKSRKEGNSIFIDHSLPLPMPHGDQWRFLSSVEKVSIAQLDGLFEQFVGSVKSEQKLTHAPKTKRKSGVITLTLSEYITISKSDLTTPLISFLREELNFVNSEYFIKQRGGLPVYDIEKYFKTVFTDDEFVYAPRGFLMRLIEYLKEEDIAYALDDERTMLPELTLATAFELFPHQKIAVDAFAHHESGVLVAPPGSGKTIMGLELIAQKRQPALIVVHRKQIYDQWIDRIENFLGIPRKDIGQLGGVKKTIKSQITVAMIQTLARQKDWAELRSTFGTILFDECHHVPAKTFREVITKLHPKFLFGLTATPKRKNNDEKLIYAYLGDIVHQTPTDYKKSQSRDIDGASDEHAIEIIIRETGLALPFQPKRTDMQIVLKILTFDTARNAQIINDIVSEAKAGKKCLVLSERKEHVELLNTYLKRDFETLVFTADFSKTERQKKEKQLHSGHFQIVIATGQLFGEGVDVHGFDCLFLVFPFSFEGKLIQYIGRIERGESGMKRVYDYRDLHITQLESMFKKRQRHYNRRKRE